MSCSHLLVSRTGQLTSKAPADPTGSTGPHLPPPPHLVRSLPHFCTSCGVCIERCKVSGCSRLPPGPAPVGWLRAGVVRPPRPPVRGPGGGGDNALMFQHKRGRCTTGISRVDSITSKSVGRRVEQPVAHSWENKTGTSPNEWGLPWSDTTCRFLTVGPEIMQCLGARAVFARPVD